MKKLPQVRASKLRLFLNCPASFAFPWIESEGGTAAEQGTAVHRFLEMIGKGWPEGSALECVPRAHWELCRRIDTTMFDFRRGEFEVSYIYDALQQKAHRLPAPEEAELDPAWTVTGTVDARYVRDDHVFIEDYKTGRPEHVTREQLDFYCMADQLSRSDAQPKRTVGAYAFIAPDSGDVRTRTAERTDAELVALQARIRCALEARMNAAEAINSNRQPSVREGDWCTYCPARSACPAKTALVRMFASGYELRPAAGPLTAQDVGKVWARMRDIQAALKGLERQLSLFVREHGPIELPTGKTLGVKTRKGNEVIDATKAIASAPELEEFASVSLTKKAIIDGIKANGGSNQQATKVLNDLRDAGAITRRADSEMIKEY